MGHLFAKNAGYKKTFTPVSESSAQFEQKTLLEEQVAAYHPSPTPTLNPNTSPNPNPNPNPDPNHNPNLTLTLTLQHRAALSKYRSQRLEQSELEEELQRLDAVCRTGLEPQASRLKIALPLTRASPAVHSAPTSSPRRSRAPRLS